MRFLKDPLWQFVGVTVSLLALAATLYLNFSAKPHRSLRVDILSNSPLVSVNADIAGDIQIVYKERPVRTLSLILLRLENAGNEPIVETDFSEPIHISLSPEAEIGEVTVQETRPEGIPLQPELTSPNQVQLARVLLNPGDQAILKILAVNNDGTLAIDARIAGISQIEVLSLLEGGQSASQTGSGQVLLLLLVAMGVFFGAVLIWDSKPIMRWRMSRLGFDPALHFYTTAQETMMKGRPTPQRMQLVVSFLKRACDWDPAYLEKVQSDPHFHPLKGYARYESFVQLHSKPKPGGAPPRI